MLIVLPPSQAKASPPPGPALQIDTLAFGSLNPVRKRVLTAVVRLCRSDQQAAMSALGLSSRQAGAVQVNAGLWTAPAAAAIEVYRGVLYEALDANTLSPAQRRRLNSMVAISSALFGLLRPMDAIPAYRLSPEVQVPTITSLAQAWRPTLSAELDPGSGLVWDLRSAAYVGLGPAPAVPGTVTSRILLERAGKRSVVSHHNKATKGRLVRAVVSGTGRIRTVEDLAEALSRQGYRCELHAAVGSSTRLDVIVDQV